MNNPTIELIAQACIARTQHKITAGGVYDHGKDYHDVNDEVAKFLGYTKNKKNISNSCFDHHDVYSYKGKLRVIAHLNCSMERVYTDNPLPDGWERVYTSYNSWYAPHSILVIYKSLA